MIVEEDEEEGEDLILFSSLVWGVFEDENVFFKGKVF